MSRHKTPEHGRLTMTVGLPGSGKSTWARQQVLAAQPGEVVRVNKDSLRTMLHADRYDGRTTEQQVLDVQNLVVSHLLRQGCGVICDDTGFGHESRMQALADAAFVPLVINRDFLDVPIDTCIARDLQRCESVGEAVIRKMYRKHIDYFVDVLVPVVRAEVPGLPWAIIVDIDGTLAHMNGRSPYDPTRYLEDSVDEVVRDLALSAMNHHDYRVIVCSGRDDTYRDVTEQWLRQHGIPFDELHMRPADDRRHDEIVKEQIFHDRIESRYNVRYVLDDRDRVVAMWRRLGLKVLQVAPGDF